MPRNYRADPMPCGIHFCPATLRMLWPVKAIRVCDIAVVYDIGNSETIRRAEALGIAAERHRRRTTKVSMQRLREIWRDETLSLAEKAVALNMLPRTLQKMARPMTCHT